MGSKRYSPQPGSYESELFARADSTSFPDDVRKSPKQYQEKLLRWTGVVRSARSSEALLVTDYEHHYWDWVEDYGAQRERAFVSPRGEGRFRCTQELKAFGDTSPRLPREGAFAVVYGILDHVEKDGTVALRCAPFIKTMEPQLYSKEIWDYGRDYLLKGDKSDFKILRVPGPLR